MATLEDVYRTVMASGFWQEISFDVRPQFGPEEDPFVLAELLPEQASPNTFSETYTDYTIQPAASGNRFSPAQLQSSVDFSGTFQVTLGTIDTARNLKPKEADDLTMLVNADADQRVEDFIQAWIDRELLQSVLFTNELQRAGALLDALVKHKTTGGKMVDTPFHRPTDHYVEIPGGTTTTPQGWYDNTHDPIPDINAMLRVLESAGFQPIQMIMTSELSHVLADNQMVANRGSGQLYIDGGTVSSLGATLTTVQLLNIISTQFNVPVRLYNKGYKSESGFKKIMEPQTDGHYLLITGRTNRNWSSIADYVGASVGNMGSYAQGVMDRASEVLMQNTLGYFGIGTTNSPMVQGPGRAIKTMIKETKPYGISGETDETGGPVPVVPEAYAVIKVLKPTP